MLFCFDFLTICCCARSIGFSLVCAGLWCAAVSLSLDRPAAFPLFSLQLEGGMPRRRKNVPDESSTASASTEQRYLLPADAPWGGFLNARLDGEHKERFQDWFSSEGSRVWQALDDVLSEGVKVSLSFDAENSAYVAALTGRLCLSLKQRWVAQGRASTWEEAVAVVLYKHFVLAEGNWDNFRPSKGDFMKWG